VTFSKIELHVHLAGTGTFRAWTVPQIATRDDALLSAPTRKPA
jgi:hypothetical protein